MCDAQVPCLLFVLYNTNITLKTCCLVRMQKVSSQHPDVIQDLYQYTEMPFAVNLCSLRAVVVMQGPLSSSAADEW